MSRWTRHRFRANVEDPRPVSFPPPGPYWITGYGPSWATVVAYLPTGEEVTKYWPEASEVDSDPMDEITFTGRFPKPEWWRGEDG